MISVCLRSTATNFIGLTNSLSALADIASSATSGTSNVLGVAGSVQNSTGAGTGGSGGGDGLNVNIGTTRIYNGGINTLLQVPLNAFGGHIIRHGLLPIESESAKYEAVALANNQEDQGKNNRLVRLKAKLEPNENADIARYISFSGQNCEDECAGWNPQDRRCECGNRRVSWNEGYDSNFRNMEIYAEAW